ncbi:ech hydrogenase subunit A [Desulfonatronum thiosulfatophilum]|uniref:Ech hydrogenase subunit A n=1 Tax=Desulfonatronum thiosulfatophilum TaxID=617002 RepID=A0A1G6A3C4_9BACT|nr:proton-conducting transporter membrane subunit [Desulfonatronum thiosulfatophilum]SDB02961.1 ech hydrogenase subunit A [Desulfonatronum thiosulfatophilum]
MPSTLLFILVVIPFIAALGVYALRVDSLRTAMVLATAVLLTGASLALFSYDTVAFSTTLLGANPGPLIVLLDFVVLFIILAVGLSAKHRLIIYLAGAQIVLLAVFKLMSPVEGTGQALFMVDPLSKLMIAVVSIVGSIIVIHGLPYMKKHEAHLHLTTSRQPQFFAVMLLFLGAMNGLVLTNDLSNFYFFFELTTLCSFLLIRHDLTDESKRNALRALWINSLGGLALLIGLFWIALDLGTVNIQQILVLSPEAVFLLVPIGLLCLGGLTKAAQLPFQSWLLGAMVAPTPVSALLHSATMVKAGIYVFMRFSPAYSGTFFSVTVALVGAFTFLAAALLAISQSNGKKILAYSTVSNLGLIIACAGVGTPAAIAAGMFLILFHAVSKALLFLCVGTIEQRIASRDIEDMRGLYAIMPVTAIIAVLAALTMILPPFGMLMGKWMAIESSAHNVLLVIILALGSAVTVLYWARWAGLFMTYPIKDRIRAEEQPMLTRLPLVGLICGAVLLSFYAPWIYSSLIYPAVSMLHLGVPDTVPATTWGILVTDRGSFPVIPLFFVAAIGLAAGYYFFKVAGRVKTSGPYLSGAQSMKDPTAYAGPLRQFIVPTTSNYYLEKIFGESLISPWLNTAALLLILLMLGGGL